MSVKESWEDILADMKQQAWDAAETSWLERLEAAVNREINSIHEKEEIRRADLQKRLDTLEIQNVELKKNLAVSERKRAAAIYG